MLACVQAVTQGRRYLDALLRHVEAVIVTLLAKSMKNRECPVSIRLMCRLRS